MASASPAVAEVGADERQLSKVIRVFLLGLAYLLIARPSENIRADARADGTDMG